MSVAKSIKKSKKVKKIVDHGVVYIKASYNNTVVSLADQAGNVLAWSSAGLKGFRGPKKATPYAAGVIVKDLVEKSQKFNLQRVNVIVKGIGYGRESAIRALNAEGIEILSIKDATPVPHNGCMPKKPRRV